MSTSPDPSLSFVIPADHPSLPGHFPGHPIVPGVVILDHIIQAVQQHHGVNVEGIRKSKFLSPLSAEEVVNIELAEIKQGKLRFRCHKQSDGSFLGEGNLLITQ